MDVRNRLLVLWWAFVVHQYIERRCSNNAKDNGLQDS